MKEHEGSHRPSHVTLYGTFKTLFSHADREKQGLWPGRPDACDPGFPGQASRISGDRVPGFRESGAKFPAPFLVPVFGDPVDMIMKGGPKTGTIFWALKWYPKNHFFRRGAGPIFATALVPKMVPATDSRWAAHAPGRCSCHVLGMFVLRFPVPDNHQPGREVDM